MLSWADAVPAKVTGVGSQPPKRAVDGAIMKKPSGHRQQIAIGIVRGSISIHGGQDRKLAMTGNIGKSASQKLHDRNIVSSLTTGSLTSRSAIKNIDPPLITLPYMMMSAARLAVGSDCSGWAAEVHALRLLGLGESINHRFACDITKASKTFILQNCRPTVWYPDCLARDNSNKSTPTVDIYVAGFPCQPYSAAGQNKGMDDSRADVFSGVLDYIRQKLPTIFILENVKNIVSKRHKATFDHILDQLMSITDSSKNVVYTVHWQVLNSQDFGVPQHRERVYFIGLRRSKITKHMKHANFLELVLSSRQPAPPIYKFLGLPRFDRKTIDGRIDADIARFSQTGSHNLLKAMASVKAAKLDPSKTDIIVDLGNGRDRVNMVHNVCPTITRTRGGRADFYLISHGSRLTWVDFFKLQGLDPRLSTDGLRDTELGQLAGNAMTIPVLAVVMRAALLFTGLARDI